MNIVDINLIKQIYGADNTELHIERINNLINFYNNTFSKKDDINIFSVSGRIEVSGNHTDHQLGNVLCASISMDKLCVCSKRNDNLIILHSEGYEPLTVDVIDTAYRKEEENTSLALIRGVCNRFKEKGYTLGGFSACVASNVPGGSGMSSSASFEGLVGNILNYFYCDKKESQVEIAKTGQYAENVYFGKPSGLMDQIACVVGGFVHIDFYDKENPIIEKIDSTIISNDYDICIIDTGDKHNDLTDEYANITKEMLEVANYFGETYLSRVSEEDFIANIPNLRKTISDRAVVRALHFFTDNNHVKMQVEALKNKNVEEFLSLVNASGNSSVLNLQNIFSTKEVEVQGSTLVISLCKKFLNGKGAVRIHGGGFGGTVQAFVPRAMTNEFKEKMEKVVGKNKCYVLSIRNIEGTRIEQ